MGEVALSATLLRPAPPCPQRPLAGDVCFPLDPNDELCLPDTVGFLQSRGSILSFWKAAVTLGMREV